MPTRSSAESLEKVLESLERELAGRDAELLLLLDQPTEAVAAIAGSTPRARSLRSPVRRGLPDLLNLGRREARGRRILLLHDDAIPEPGWLDALLAASHASPDAAILGSLQLDSAGAPRRGSSLVWREGFTTPEPLDDLPSEGASAVSADYVGTSSMLIDLEAFDAAGGADPRFHPAYYVDVDLCFRVRARGGRVAFVPGSRVVHLESSSSSGPFKEYLLERNRELFVAKWAERLRLRPPYAPDDGARAALRSRVEQEVLEGAAGHVPLPPSDPTPPVERRRDVTRGYVDWLEARSGSDRSQELEEELRRARAELAREA